ncbi:MULTISPECIES: pentapeptide repeat-containing protein [Pacificibacter]|uniref:pentapeptide repeat-containing protein n=1 Tax=Pacificibacter TaxID=1042323 RepID=UPI001C0A1BF7|nr:MULTISPECIES: pentapeptide repeat-containing protein [Pacificibacter]MBU2937069.1 pentapeptide repeat-containing protein [Pacificibacter marinus]MDO6616391.1 pentapeptide repeat-containing protein [Pacificibacter sp. 1_MG-2023]
MQRFESWDEIDAYYQGGLTLAEQKLKIALATGAPCTLGDLPNKPVDWSKPDPTRHIRADVLRYALTRPFGADDATEFGVSLYGAAISGELDLIDCTIHGNASLRQCRFQKMLFADRARFMKNVNLTGSHLPALLAPTAYVNGQLICRGTIFTAKHGSALDLQGIAVEHDVFLTGASANASVDLNGAIIGGQLGLRGMTLSVKAGLALDLEGVKIESGFFFIDIKSVVGSIDLSSAHVGNLVDDPASWDKVTNLILDGFTYDRISGSQSSTDYKTRLRWLKTSDNSTAKFRPQPYNQLAKVLREMGHERDAREIKVVLAGKLKTQDRKERVIKPNGNWGVGVASAWRDLSNAALWIWHVTSLRFIGHGYKPENAIAVLLTLILFAWGAADQAWKAGDFAPNSALILNSDDWRALSNAPHQAQAWGETVVGKDWESFNSFAYAADVVIPIVDFSQTQAWAPSTNRGPWGATLWWARWLFTAAGWIISALGAAAITGVIRRE